MSQREVERLLEEALSDEVDSPRQGLMRRIIERQGYLLKQVKEIQRRDAWEYYSRTHRCWTLGGADEMRKAFNRGEWPPEES